MTAFRFLVPHSRSGLLGALHDGDRAGIEIDLSPLQCSDLATTQAATDTEEDGDKQPRPPDRLDEFDRLRHIISAHLCRHDFRRLYRVTRIAIDRPIAAPSDGLGERLFEQAVNVPDSPGRQSAASAMAAFEETGVSVRYGGGL